MQDEAVAVSESGSGTAGSESGLHNPEQPHHRSARHKRKAIRGVHRRWTNNIIPYEINGDMSMILHYFLFSFLKFGLTIDVGDL